ncbi:hypothetical protein EVAR_532_1 [Eumeta japonica]|uniref:Uncharacterized protein n=1 Tax=Eumeta variegata TaxID=151549 RepID=A0A4C1SAX8_EUMVA|nr:hypothetical protein EVAR_532_1 [Eumeta japonica]
MEAPLLRSKYVYRFSEPLYFRLQTALAQFACAACGELCELSRLFIVQDVLIVSRKKDLFSRGRMTLRSRGECVIYDITECRPISRRAGCSLNGRARAAAGRGHSADVFVVGCAYK